MNIRTSVFRGAAILSLTALGLAACEGKDQIILPTETPAVEVTVAPTQVQLTVGQTATAGAVVKNSTNQTVSWACSNTAVATVTAAGVITAVAPGSTVCTATAAADAAAKGLVSVTVVPATITLSVLPTTATINSVAPGNTIQLATTVSGSTNTAVTCVSSATGVATVANGLVTAVAPGTAVITCTAAADQNVKAAAVITVVAPQTQPVAITLQPATATIAIAGTVQMVAIVTGSTNQAVTYASSDTSVATVDANGKVTGKKGGTAVITATAAADNTKKATAVITVSGAPPEPSISIASIVHNGEPVNPSDISGQVDVTVNVSAVPENGVRAVVVMVDDKEVCRQNFSSPLGTTQGVATINCPVSTAAIDSSAVPWVPRFLNGPHTFYARALDANGVKITEAQFCPVAPLPGQPCIVTFDNSDVAVVRVTFDNAPDPSMALDQNGLRWNGGDVTATAYPIMYSGRVIASLEGDLFCDRTSEPDAVDTFDYELVNGVWTYTWDQVDDLPYTYWECGVDADAGVDATGASFGFGDEAQSAPFWLDNEAPEPFDAELPETVLDNNHYAGTTTAFTPTTLQGVPDSEDADQGVDRVTFKIFAVLAADLPADPDQDELAAAVASAGAMEITSANQLPESTIQNNVYVLIVVAKDALGNVRYDETDSFGVDLTLPTLAFGSGSAASNSTNPAADLRFDITDTYSGPFVVRVRKTLYSVLEYDTDAGTEVRCLDDLGNVTSPPSSGICPTFDHTIVDILNNTTDTAWIALENAPGIEGYIVTEAQAVDRAGNLSAMLTRTVLMDLTAPAGTIDQYTVITATNSISLNGTIKENVDLASYDVRYNFPLTTIPTQVPFTQAVAVDTYGLPLTGVLAVTGQNAVNVREITEPALAAVAPTSVGFGATDVAGNFGYISQALAFAVGNGTGLTFNDAGGMNTFDMDVSATIDRSSAPNQTLDAVVQVGPTDLNPISTVYFYLVNPGVDAVYGNADDYLVLLGIDNTATVFTGVLERKFTFQQAITAANFPANGTWRVVALGVASDGDAILSDVPTVTVQD